MTRIFIPGQSIDGDTFSLSGKDSVHIASALRMKENEELILCDGGGNDYYCKIVSTSPKETVCRVIERRASPSALPVRLHVYQSLPKGDKLDLIVQKITELGAASLTPVLSDRCVSRPDEKSLSKKCARWSEIAKEAAQQCGRGDIPVINPALSFKEAANGVPVGFLKIFCNEEERETALKSVLKKTDDIAVFIGPEGGYSDAERELARECDFISVTFGNRILRCETAPIYVASCVAYEFG